MLEIADKQQNGSIKNNRSTLERDNQMEGRNEIPFAVLPAGTEVTGLTHLLQGISMYENNRCSTSTARSIQDMHWKSLSCCMLSHGQGYLAYLLKPSIHGYYHIKIRCVHLKNQIPRACTAFSFFCGYSLHFNLMLSYCFQLSNIILWYIEQWNAPCTRCQKKFYRLHFHSAGYWMFQPDLPFVCRFSIIGWYSTFALGPALSQPLWPTASKPNLYVNKSCLMIIVSPSSSKLIFKTSRILMI